MADKSKNTGTGGFDIGGDKYSYDVGVPDASGGNQGKWSAGDISVNQTPKDLSKPTRIKLGQYLSKVTLQKEGSSTHPNVYPVGSGDQTVIKDLSLKDADGHPTPPGQSQNEANFSQSFSSKIGSHDSEPKMKRGLGPGSAPDGNKLLPDAAAPGNAGGPYVKPSNGLKDNLKKYTKKILDANEYSPLADSATPDVVIGDGGDIFANNIRDLYTTTDLATDGGTSEKVAKKTFVDESNLVQTATIINVYPVDSPVVGDALKTFKLDSSAALAGTENTVLFSDVKIGVSDSQVAVTANSKGKLKIGDAPDGNKLLPDAAEPAAAGGNYVKYAKNLKDPVKKYTAAVVDPNLNDYDSIKILVSDGTLGQPPVNLRDIRIMSANSSVETDGGTSKNILGPDGTGNYTLTISEAAAQAAATTMGNVYPVDAPSNPFLAVTFRTPNNNPISVTAAQNSPSNAKIFTLNLLSSYSDEYAAAKEDLKLKRGKTEGGVIDGNDLLPNIAPVDSNIKSPVLSSGATSYLGKFFDKNLNKYYDPKTESSMGSQLGDGGSQAPGNIKPLHVSQNFAADAGTSKNILEDADPNYVLTEVEAATQANKETSKNSYPVDAPLTKQANGAEVLDALSLNSAAALGKSGNSKSYADLQIGSYPLVNSKGNLKNKDLPDGNSLLISAADKKPGAEKYATLKDPIKSYTQNNLSKNLYKPEDIDNKSIVEKGDFFGPKFLHKVKSTVDLGTFDDIAIVPDRQISKIDLLNRFENEVKGENAPGGIGNTYKPSPENNKDFSFTSPSGYPVSPTDEQAAETDSGIYAPGKVPTSYSDDITNLKGKLARGRSSLTAGNEGVPDGNTLLKDATKPAPSGGAYVKKAGGDGGVDPTSPISGYVSEILKRNRFQPINDIKFEKPDDRNAVSFSNKYELGSSAGNDNDTKRNYSFKRLSQVGAVLQLRSTGEIAAVKTGGDSVNPSDEGTILSTLLPGVGQIGLSRKIEELDIKSVIAEMTNEPIKDFQYINPNTEFQGVMNSVFEKFSGFSALGMQTVTISLVVAIGLAIEAVSLLLRGGTDIEDINKPLKVAGTARYGIGTFRGTFSNEVDLGTALLGAFAGGDNPLPRLLGILPTKEDLNTAVFDGIGLFFGVVGGSIKSEKSPPVLQSPGYYTVMARAIVKSALKIVYAFKDMVDAFSGGGGFSGIAQLFETFEIIRKSRFIASINVFAQLGDKINEGTDDVTVKHLDAGLKISTVDKIPDDAPAAAFLKSRLGNGIESGVLTTKLSWSTNRSPAHLLVPRSSQVLAALGGFKDAGRLLTHDPLTKIRFLYSDQTQQITENRRISSDEREAIEKKFDSEYLPFYFHDLRTNEFLGFHAFLMSLGDDYSAGYDSLDAYGRVDPIKTYKNTTRKISLSFMIAALDELDFDDMWLKINKLTTLVYPQYTEGKLINTSGISGKDNYTFRKPFTQQIGASPMIRLRVGNLFSSNYSKFNIAGIFGATDSQTTLKKEGQTDDGKLNSTSEAGDFAKSVKVEKFYAQGYKFNPKSIDYFASKEISSNIDPTAALSAKDATKLPFNPGKYGIFYAEIVDNSNVKEREFVDVIFAYKKDIQNNDAGYISYQKDVVEKKSARVVADKVRYRVHISNLIEMIPETQDKYNASIIKTTGQFAPNLIEFLNEGSGKVGDKPSSGNAITRSFRSAGGKGLAGFIESMSFDWYSGVTWDTSTGRKAPKMCKVTISFSPVHDISPGLDANGYNRAPIYPIGPYAYPTE